MAVYGPIGSNELYHYGIPRKSGRYPYGSGKEPYQDDPKKRRLNKDESAPKATSKRPESIWAKHRRAQAEKKASKDREAKKAAAEKAEEEHAKAEAEKPPSQKIKDMSDAELVAAINRLRLEQTYMSMIVPQKQSSQQEQNAQNSSQQLQKAQQTTKNGKKFIDKLKNSTKDLADLSTNIGNLSGGIQKTYSNYLSIMKLMDAAKKRKNG